MRTFDAIFCSFLIVTLLTVGCGADAENGVTASGTVTVGIDRLSGAVITLEPISGTTGPNASAPVLEGRFAITAEAGLHGGLYRVRVSMIPKNILALIPNEAGVELPPDNAVIHPRYDANSQLTWQLNRGDENEANFKVEFLN